MKKFNFKRMVPTYLFYLLHEFFVDNGLTFILNPEGLIHSKRNIVNVAAWMATTPTRNHEAVSNGSVKDQKWNILSPLCCYGILLVLLDHFYFKIWRKKEALSSYTWNWRWKNDNWAQNRAGKDGAMKKRTEKKDIWQEK